MDLHLRERDLQTLVYPLTRLAGNALLALAVVLHVRCLGAAAFIPSPILLSTGLLVGYGLLAWVVTLSSKQKPVEIALLAGDVVVWTAAAIVTTGGPSSWLFFVPLLRVADQAFFSVKRALAFGALGACGFALTAAFWPEPVASEIVWVKLAFLVFAIAYITVTASTAASVRERMSKAMRDARSAAEAKSRFLANMSHEIRTPLNGVLGMNELMLGSSLQPEQRRWAETIKTSGEHLLGVLNHVLDMSKLEASKVVLESLDFDLRHLIEDVVAVYRDRAARGRVEMTHFVDPAVPERLRGDPGRLRQVLFNLVGNAVKFTEKGEISLSVHAVSTTLVFTVKDTGMGIAPDVIPQLFESFTQADASTTRKHGGSGLGLSIAREIVRLMHGDMTVRSQVGVGTTFEFSIVLEAAKTLPTIVRADPRELQGSRLLVIDDNATNRDLMMALLQEWNVDAVAADGGPTATTLARAQQFDAAIIDMHMPDADGLTVAAQLHEIQPQMHLVALTSVAVPGAARMAKEAGFNAFLTKPVRREEMRDCLLALRQPRSGDTELITRHSLREAERREEPLVLVADDNPTNQKVIAGMLASLGCQMDIVDNGRKVLDALASGRPYIALLLDCEMPELDGFATARAIRHGAYAKLPIIALSAHSDAAIRRRAMDAGMDDWLSKPLALDTLRKMLGRWLTKASSAPLLDDKVIADLTAVDETGSVLQRVLDMYFEDAQKRIDKMSEASQGGQHHDLKDLAHALKGSSLSVGALAVAASCRVIERALEDPTVNVMPLILTLPADLQSFQDALSQHLGRAISGVRIEDAHGNEHAHAKSRT